MGKLVKYPESDITKEIEKDGFKVTIEVYKGDEGGWILEIEDEQWNSAVWDEESRLLRKKGYNPLSVILRHRF
jgi:hypothetical protein